MNKPKSSKPVEKKEETTSNYRIAGVYSDLDPSDLVENIEEFRKQWDELVSNYPEFREPVFTSEEVVVGQEEAE
jgi:hypothetical protein